MREVRQRTQGIGAPATVAHVSEWRRLIDDLLAAEDAGAPDGDAAAKPATSNKRTRFATYDLVLAVERQLTLSAGTDLCTFFPQRPLQEKITARPRITISWDMGPDNLCAAAYLLNKKKLRASIMFSPLHKLQRCMWGGVQEAGKYAIVMVGGIIANLDHGPFDSKSFHLVLKQSNDEFLAKAMADDPLLRKLAPRIQRDRCGDPNITGPAHMEEILLSLGQARWLNRKTPTVAMSRWNTWNDCMEFLLPEWHHKLLAMLHHGAIQGWYRPANRAKFLNALHPITATKQADDVAKETVAASKAKMQQLRDKCRGSMQLSTFAMMDPDFQIDTRQIVFATSSWRVCHGVWQSLMVSEAAAMKFHVDIANRNGAFWTALLDCMRPLRKADDLMKMGFIMSCDSIPLETLLDETHPVCLQQRGLAVKLFDLLFAETKYHLRGFNHFFDGYPGKFAVLPTSIDADIRWRDMYRDFLAFQAASKYRQGQWRNLCAGSSLGWTEVQEMFDLGPALCPDAISNVDRIFGYQGDSTVVEKCFQKCADHSRDSSNGNMSASSRWRAPVRTQLLTSEYKFTREVSVNDVSDNVRAKSELPSSIFVPKFHDTSMDFKDLPSYKGSAASWKTYSPETWHTIVFNQKLMRLCFDEGKMGEVDQTWKAELMQEKVVVTKGQGLYMCIATSQHICMLWPVKEIKIGPYRFLGWEPPNPSLPHYDTVFDLRVWAAIPYQVATPLDLLRANKGRAYTEWPDVFGIRDGDAQPLLHYAARCGFWGLPEEAIDRIALRELNMAESSGDLVEKLLVTIRAILDVNEDRRYVANNDSLVSRLEL